MSIFFFINRFFFSPRLRIYFMSLLLGLSAGACSPECPKQKDLFWGEYQNLVNEVKNTKRKRDSRDWDRLDRHFSRLVGKCQPLYADSLKAEERLWFWQQAMGYVYARYGLELLEKYSDTDRLLLRLRDSLAILSINIPANMDSLSRDWPIFLGMEGSKIGYSLEKILRREKKDTLLPKWRD